MGSSENLFDNIRIIRIRITLLIPCGKLQFQKTQRQNRHTWDISDCGLAALWAPLSLQQANSTHKRKNLVKNNSSLAWSCILVINPQFVLGSVLFNANWFIVCIIPNPIFLKCIVLYLQHVTDVNSPLETLSICFGCVPSSIAISMVLERKVDLNPLSVLFGVFSGPP